METGKRLYSYDNLKLFLIFTVILGHLLEVSSPFPGHSALYMLIYSFHMPLFVLLSGMFAKYNKKRIVFQLCVPYVCFQILYTLFEKFILKNEAAYLTFAFPHRILWYQFALIVYHLLLPLFDQKSTKSRLLTLGALTLLSLLSGFDREINYMLSLARIINFLPFFVLGHYLGTDRDQAHAFLARPSRKRRLVFVLSIILPILSLGIMLFTPSLSCLIMKASLPYSESEGSVLLRLLTIFIASSWILFFYVFFNLFFNKRIPFLTVLGQNTLPAFLMHGFIMQLANRYGWFSSHGILDAPLILLAAAVIIAAFSNPYFAHLFGFLFGGKFPSGIARK